MFKRREKPNLLHRTLRFLWPKTGLKRAYIYLGHRLARLPGSPYSIAAGFACGVAIAFTPLLGFHLLLSAVLAWLIGGNVIASALGSLIGNPWTYPFMWILIFRVGNAMIGGSGVSESALTLDNLNDLYELLHNFFVAGRESPPSVYANLKSLFVPMMLGCIPVGIIAWLLAYFPANRLVSMYQAKRRLRRMKNKPGQRAP